MDGKNKVYTILTVNLSPLILAILDVTMRRV